MTYIPPVKKTVAHMEAIVRNANTEMDRLRRKNSNLESDMDSAIKSFHKVEDAYKNLIEAIYKRSLWWRIRNRKVVIPENKSPETSTK